MPNIRYWNSHCFYKIVISDRILEEFCTDFLQKCAETYFMQGCTEHPIHFKAVFMIVMIIFHCWVMFF